jgi:hypothetical protein
MQAPSFSFGTRNAVGQNSLHSKNTEISQNIAQSNASVYLPPSWALSRISVLLPEEEFSLEVLKDGIVLEIINLKKSHYIIGRQEDAVHITCAHGSISRQHAVLQYSKNKTLHLLDLKSAQGTYFNRDRVESGEYYRLCPGDQIKFGASTRVYVVSGPESQQKEEEDSAELQTYRTKRANDNDKIRQRQQQ